ncbi:MAG: thioredoxin domain-containing protein [Candidatus Competibacteraceae bacterium]
MHNPTHVNHLSQETSPYLLQHAHNPVDWYPWGEEALNKARQENKPILLSIGYSACHWCHVMAHESFEDEATARLMNDYFVNIKIDREERPDLDKIYQTAYQLLNGRGGGWPLNMFLTPNDQVPFLGITYLPKEPRYGMPAFTELLQRIMSYYREHESEVRKQNSSLLGALKAGPSRQAKTGYTLNPTPLQEVRDQLAGSFDPVHGGFGQAPKFPHPTSLERLLRHWAHSTMQDDEPDQHADHMVQFAPQHGAGRYLRSPRRRLLSAWSMRSGRLRISRKCCTTMALLAPYSQLGGSAANRYSSRSPRRPALG